MAVHFLAAGVAEVVGNVTRNPFEVIKQQMQVGWGNSIKEAAVGI